MKVAHALMIWLLPALAGGCRGGDKCEDGCESSPPDDSGEGEGEGEPTFAASWSAEGVTITVPLDRVITQVGMAETDPSSFDPWTGEDCVRGYTLSDGSSLLYCHPMAGESLSLESASDFMTLDEDTQTWFWRSSANAITYAAWDGGTGECWTWGNDPSYYTAADIGCTAI